jgi:sulfate transport system permease protein
MAGHVSAHRRGGAPPARPHLTEPAGVRWTLVFLALAFLAIFLAVPLAMVFSEAFASGIDAYRAAIADPDARSAIRLTLVVTALAVPSNLAFGLSAAWAIAKFRFPGRNLLVTLIDLPFAVSPVIAGLVFVLLFGRRGWFGPWLFDHDIRIVFALPGIVLATLFVSFPFIAREVIPILEASGSEQEEAARALGAGGLQTFVRVTLPNIKWGLLYGVILCSARAMGEFGAVSVVSGHIRGRTNTVPLHVEILYNDYNFQAAFAVASVLAVVAIVTLVARTVIERRIARELEAPAGAAVSEPV